LLRDHYRDSEGTIIIEDKKRQDRRKQKVVCFHFSFFNIFFHQVGSFWSGFSVLHFFFLVCTLCFVIISSSKMPYLI
jgi:hypothetical protein